MFEFRGREIDTGREVEGSYVPLHGRHFLVDKEYGYLTELGERDGMDYYRRGIEVTPESLAMSTGKKDINGKMIFGSFEVDGKMSKGGDRYR